MSSMGMLVDGFVVYGDASRWVCRLWRCFSTKVCKSMGTLVNGSMSSMGMLVDGYIVIWGC